MAAFLGAAYLGSGTSWKLHRSSRATATTPAKAEIRPGDLTTALDALEADADLCELPGPAFVAAFQAYKRNEVERFSHWVTDWEFREYSYHL